MKPVFCIILLTVILSIILIESNYDHRVWATQCSSQSISAEYEESSSVFSGKVIDISRIFLSENTNYQFKVDRVFKGNVPDIVDVEVSDRTNTVHFRGGYDYVVFSKTNGHIQYYVQDCDPHLHPTKTLVKLLETGVPDFTDSSGIKLHASKHMIESIMEPDELEFLNQLEEKEWNIHSGETWRHPIPHFPLFWYLILAGIACLALLLMVLCNVYKKSETGTPFFSRN